MEYHERHFPPRNESAVEAIGLSSTLALNFDQSSETGFLSTFTAQSVRIFIAHQMTLFSFGVSVCSHSASVKFVEKGSVESTQI